MDNWWVTCILIRQSDIQHNSLIYHITDPNDARFVMVNLVCVSVFVSVYICISAYICMHIYIPFALYICIHIAYIYMYTLYIYKYIYIHIYIYIHFALVDLCSNRYLESASAGCYFYPYSVWLNIILLFAVCSADTLPYFSSPRIDMRKLTII